jgi:hypothetical protein
MHGTGREKRNRTIPFLQGFAAALLLIHVGGPAMAGEPAKIAQADEPRAFRRHESPFTGFLCEPREIAAEAEYAVTFSRAYAPDTATRMRGADLQRLNIETPDRPGSFLVEYARVRP